MRFAVIRHAVTISRISGLRLSLWITSTRDTSTATPGGGAADRLPGCGCGFTRPALVGDLDELGAITGFQFGHRASCGCVRSTGSGRVDRRFRRWTCRTPSPFTVRGDRGTAGRRGPRARRGRRVRTAPLAANVRRASPWPSARRGPRRPRPANGDGGPRARLLQLAHVEWLRAGEPLEAALHLDDRDYDTWTAA